MPYAIHFFAYANSDTPQNDVLHDTYPLLEEAVRQCRRRMVQSYQPCGWARVVDASLIQENGTTGMIAEFKKDHKGNVYCSDIRRGYEIRVRSGNL